MKKFVLYVLIAVMCLGLCACGAAGPERTEGTTDSAAETTEITAETTVQRTEATTEDTAEAVTEAVTEAEPHPSDYPADPALWEDLTWAQIEVSYALGIPENLTFEAGDICTPGVFYEIYNTDTVAELAGYFIQPDITPGGDWVRGPSNTVIEFSNGFRCHMVYTFMDEQNVKLHPYVKVTDPEGQPVYYTLSDEGVSYIFDLLQRVEVKYTAE